jgi:hypothetical protein
VLALAQASGSERPSASEMASEQASTLERPSASVGLSASLQASALKEPAFPEPMLKSEQPLWQEPWVRAGA